MLVSGKPSSYRPVDSHLTGDRVEQVLKIVNKLGNPNKTITEGLELYVFRETGSVEEKLKAMNIGLREIVEYLESMKLPKVQDADVHEKSDVIEVEVTTGESLREATSEGGQTDRRKIAENATAVSSGLDMISTMYRE